MEKKKQKNETPSIIKKQPPSRARVGISVPDKRHMKPLNDSNLKDEVGGDKAHIFEPNLNESDPEPKDLLIDADPTEAIDEEEEIASYTGGEVYTAGGMDYDVMVKTVGVINNKTSSQKEEQEAGKVLHEHQDTELVSQMMSSKGALSLRITSLIDLRLQEHMEEEKQGVAHHSNESDEFNGFDANEYF